MSSIETKQSPQQLDTELAKKINQQGWMGWLELFADLGLLRQLDLQLARFLASKERTINLMSPLSWWRLLALNLVRVTAV